jgi:hypothetical protein
MARSEAAELGLPLPDYPVCVTSSTVAECSRVGRKWRIAVRNRSVLIDDSIGMIHLAVLIANPRREIQAADLVAGLAALSGGISDGGAAHPVLDREAIGDYRTRAHPILSRPGRARPRSGGQGHPPGAAAYRRGRPVHRRALAPDGTHRRALLLLARLMSAACRSRSCNAPGTGWNHMDRRRGESQ